MDTYFFVDAAGDGDSRHCRPCDQAHGPARPPLGEIGASLGRPAFQHEVSRVSFRARCGLNSIFWRLNFRSAAHRLCSCADSDSDRVLADVHRRTLSLRRCLRSGAGDFLCCASGAFSPGTSRKSATANRKLGAEGVRFELTRPFGLPVFKTGAINRSATPPGVAHLRPEIHYPITPLLQVKSRGRALEKRSIE